MSGQPWKIRSNDRLFLTGKTGVGKSVAARKLVWEQLPDVVYYDMTGEEADKLNAPVLTEIEDVEAALFADDEENHLTKFVYAPELPTLEDFERLCKALYEHRDIHLIADELMMVYRQGNSVKPLTDHHALILSNGRKKGVGITGATQRPVNVPLESISEAEHIFTFRLKLPKDADRMKQVCGPTVEEAPNLDPYHYIYDHDLLEQPKKCTPLDI